MNLYRAIYNHQKLNTDISIQVYDEYIVARITIGLIMIAFSLPACAGIFMHFSRKEEVNVYPHLMNKTEFTFYLQLSTLSHDIHDLWQN